MKRFLVLIAAGLVVVGVFAAASASVRAVQKPVLGELAYGGLAKDVVGRLAVAKPNGERDALFTATLSVPKRTVLQHVVLQRVFAKGGYAEGWDTNPGTSASILAVLLDGKRLNKVDRDLNAPLAPGTHRLVLYANDHYGVFAPGQLFRVTAAFPSSVTAAATTKLAGARPTLTATFTGLGEDVAGRGTDQKPNGEPDAHFALTLDTHGSWQVIDDVVLRRLTLDGCARPADLPHAGPADGRPEGERHARSLADRDAVVDLGLRADQPEGEPGQARPVRERPDACRPAELAVRTPARPTASPSTSPTRPCCPRRSRSCTCNTAFGTPAAHALRGGVPHAR